MNRTLIILSSTAALAAAAYVGFLSAGPCDVSARSAARETIASLTKELQTARTEIAELKARLDKPAPPPSAPQVTASAPIGVSKPAEVTATKPSVPSSTPDSPMKAFKKMMEAPGMKDMMKQQQLSQIETGYGRLFEDLHLNPEEREQFKQLIAGRLTAATELSLKLMDAGSNPGAMKQIKDRRTASARSV